MDKFNYDSYCGLYCGACSVLKAYQTGSKDDLAVFFGDEAGLELKCCGCKSDTVFSNCVNCQIRYCAADKKVEHCIECKEYPCSLLSPDNLKYMTDRVPHVCLTSQGLLAIQEVGLDQWLADQAIKWKCPECQTDFSWYTAQCSKCGKDLRGIKGYKNQFDKSIFDYLKK